MLTDRMVLLLWVFIIAVIVLVVQGRCAKNEKFNPVTAITNIATQIDEATEKALCTAGICPEEEQQVEGFYTYPGYYKKYCPSCGWRSRYNCSKCTNCGYCVTASGYGECVPGDSSGPYFRSDCMYWEYGDAYDFYPYSHVFPVIKTYDNYPYYRWNLKKSGFGYRKRNLRRKLRHQARNTRNLRNRLKYAQQ